MSDYPAFPKIPRWNREVIITEKIDGTNGLIEIRRLERDDAAYVEAAGGFYVYAGSRNRWLTVDQDNFGFAKWVEANAETLVEDLGEGAHFGEWWGLGIQRAYGLDHKRFSLFNTKRWGDQQAPFETPNLSVVPVLAIGTITSSNGGQIHDLVAEELDYMIHHGSEAVPGFMRPEGVVIYHTAANAMFKATLEHDGISKGEAEKLAVA